eukprot:13533543-Alexandrium_andersonii.AAC.1
MSASLVGSEMCIRDSFSCMKVAKQASMERLNACKEGATTQARAKQRAVSYTHLTLPTICSV